MSGVARWALALAVAGTAFGAAVSLGVASGLPTLLRNVKGRLSAGAGSNGVGALRDGTLSLWRVRDTAPFEEAGPGFLPRGCAQRGWVKGA